MNVIMIGSHLRVTGGITRVVKNYIQGGLSSKVNLEYFPTYYGSKLTINVIFFILQYFKLFYRLKIQNKTYDLAHIHMSYKGSFVRKRLIIELLSAKQIPIVLHMHGSQFKDFYNESSKEKKFRIIDTLNKTRVIIALGENWKKYYESICTTKVVSIDNAVFPKENIRTNEDKVYITSMGVLSTRKGTYDLIDAGAMLKNKIDPKYKILLAGDGEIDKVKARISSLGLEELFVVPGWVSNDEDIDRLYNKSILYILPSYNEGMPMSILEAMSYGIPVISTNVGSIPLVVDEGNGFILKPGDITGIANAIIKLLENEILVTEMGENNKKKIDKQYNIYASIDKVFELYKVILK